ncbi:MAG TPA: BrnA antitoxin family protein [Bryobacteraceae bacterium]|nr:BrnA antitoxin family protein [Bryobacteraceae bacterium]
MKTYDFSKSRRGPVVQVPEGKEKITIRLDKEIVDWFRDRVDSAGGGNYQTLINAALRDYIEGRSQTLEAMLRRVVREELNKGHAA